MKTPRLKDWVEGSVQVGMFVRTKIGETDEYRSRLVTASNQARIAKILAQLLMESRELAAEVHKALGAMLLEGGPGLLTGAKSAAWPGTSASRERAVIRPHIFAFVVVSALAMFAGIVWLAVGYAPPEPETDPWYRERHAAQCTDLFFEIGGWGYSAQACPRPDQRMTTERVDGKILAFCRCVH